MNKVLNEFWQWSMENDEDYQLDMVHEFLSSFTRGELLEFLGESLSNVSPAKIGREVEDLVYGYFSPHDLSEIDENLPELGYDVARKLGYL